MRGVTVGIDIGTTAVTTVVARRGRDGRWIVSGVGVSPSAGLRKGAVVDAEAAAASLRKSVQEASRASGSTIRSAVVGVSGAHLGSSLTRGVIAVSRADGEITEDDVGRVLRAAEGFISKSPNREIIHVMPREFKIDGERGIRNPVGMVGMKLEVEALVIDGAKPALQNVIRAAELAGLEIEDWVASPLAASEALLTDTQRELGVVLLDLGAGTSDFAVFEEGQLLDLGSFPIGGSHITSDIAIGLRTQVAAAEDIKLRYAHVIPERGAKREVIRLADFVDGGEGEFATRDLVEIVSARLTDIFELATKALRKVGRAGLLPGGVVLTGGVADIPGIQELARRELKLPVEVAKAVGGDTVADVVPRHLAVPFGLILWRERHEGEQRGRGRRPFGGLIEAVKRALRSFVP